MHVAISRRDCVRALTEIKDAYEDNEKIKTNDDSGENDRANKTSSNIHIKCKDTQ